MAIECNNFIWDALPPYIQNKDTGEFVHSREELIKSHLDCKATCDMINCVKYKLFTIISAGIESRNKRGQSLFSKN